MKNIERASAALLLAMLSPMTMADEIGLGTDGPSAAPTNPDETSDEAASFLDVVMATFEISADE